MLESLCRVLGHTEKGLTHTQIEQILKSSKLKDIDPNNSKWKRLFNAFVSFQENSSCSNNVLLFIQKAVNPARYLDREEEYEDLRFKLNKILSFEGFELKDTGKFTSIKTSSTISDAERRANKLVHKLEIRKCHKVIFKYCKAELLADNYFHAVFEAVKSIADKIRLKTGLTEDGSALVDKVFPVNNPLLKINALSNDTEKSEHKGFANLLKGVFGMFRNTTAHAPKITWEINEQDALDILSLVSLIHRRLDNTI